MNIPQYKDFYDLSTAQGRFEFDQYGEYLSRDIPRQTVKCFTKYCNAMISEEVGREKNRVFRGFDSKDNWYSIKGYGPFCLRCCINVCMAIASGIDPEEALSGMSSLPESPPKS